MRKLTYRRLKRTIEDQVRGAWFGRYSLFWAESIRLGKLDRSVMIPIGRSHLFTLERFRFPNLLSAVMTSLRCCVERSMRLFIVPFLLRSRPRFFRSTIDANKVFVNIPKWWRII